MTRALRKADRQQAILAELRASPAIRISMLAAQFNVSTETVRRDLDEMSGQGLISRTYGGAAGPAINLEPSLDDRYRTLVDQRSRIARVASTLIKPGENLMIDAGATTIYVARRLAAELRDLTVVTTSFGVASALATNSTMRVIVCPGELDSRDGGVAGPDTLDYLKRFNPAWAIIGASGLDAQGPSDVNSTSAWIKRAMIEQAEKVVLVADQTKFDRTAFERICPLASLDHLVTDSEPPTNLTNSLAKAKVNVHVAPQ
jgi:DeoR/GlpR family transcriptional regulator of sugar metabolism